MKTIKLEDIRTDGGTQTRAEMNGNIIQEYSDAVLEGAQFPPVDVFHDGADNWLADGFHRYHAHKRAGVLDIVATVHAGTQDDALVFALGANSKNGLRRTNEDKRRCVEIALERWPEWSDRRIAEVCGVSANLPGKMRHDVSPGDTSQTRTDTLGRKQPATKPKHPVPPHPDDIPEMYPVETSETSEEAIMAGEEAAKDSETLWVLKSAWKRATKKDRTAFIKWVQK